MFESLVDLEFFLMLNNIKLDFLTLSISLLAFSQFFTFIFSHFQVVLEFCLSKMHVSSTKR